MQALNRNIYNWPNFVSLLRLLMAPVLIGLAVNQQPVWFLAVVLFSAFTDALDGFLARLLNQITELGSHLDSWGDFFIYNCMAVGAWLLWPDIVLREKLSFIVIVASFTLPAAAGLIKFHTLTSYHTWSEAGRAADIHRLHTVVRRAARLAVSAGRGGLRVCRHRGNRDHAAGTAAAHRRSLVTAGAEKPARRW